ncbi:MAG: hypothetical protein FWH21_00550 [Kiritimatiellaeota bacterium]|nr:hypothetical protein [Kiritimatiellota bacterium]
MAMVAYVSQSTGLATPFNVHSSVRQDIPFWHVGQNFPRQINGVDVAEMCCRAWEMIRVLTTYRSQTPNLTPMFPDLITNGEFDFGVMMRFADMYRDIIFNHECPWTTGEYQELDDNAAYMNGCDMVVGVNPEDLIAAPWGGHTGPLSLYGEPRLFDYWAFGNSYMERYVGEFESSILDRDLYEDGRMVSAPYTRNINTGNGFWRRVGIAGEGACLYRAYPARFGPKFNSFTHGPSDRFGGGWRSNVMFGEDVMSVWNLLAAPKFHYNFRALPVANYLVGNDRYGNYDGPNQPGGTLANAIGQALAALQSGSASASTALLRIDLSAFSGTTAVTQTPLGGSPSTQTTYRSFASVNIREQRTIAPGVRLEWPGEWAVASGYVKQIDVYMTLDVRLIPGTPLFYWEGNPPRDNEQYFLQGGKMPLFGDFNLQCAGQPVIGWWVRNPNLNLQWGEVDGGDVGIGDLTGHRPILIKAITNPSVQDLDLSGVTVPAVTFTVPAGMAMTGTVTSDHTDAVTGLRTQMTATHESLGSGLTISVESRFFARAQFNWRYMPGYEPIDIPQPFK